MQTRDISYEGFPLICTGGIDLLRKFERYPNSMDMYFEEETTTSSLRQNRT